MFPTRNAINTALQIYGSKLLINSFKLSIWYIKVSWYFTKSNGILMYIQSNFGYQIFCKCQLRNMVSILSCLHIATHTNRCSVADVLYLFIHSLLHVCLLNNYRERSGIILTIYPIKDKANDSKRLSFFHHVIRKKSEANWTTLDIRRR